MLELKEFKAHVEYDATFSDEDFLSISERLGPIGRAIVNSLVNNNNEAMPARLLAAKLVEKGYEGVTTQIVQDHYETLKGQELLEVTPGKGAILTPRGVGFFRQLSDVHDFFRQQSGTSRKDVPEVGQKKSAQGRLRKYDVDEMDESFGGVKSLGFQSQLEAVLAVRNAAAGIGDEFRLEDLPLYEQSPGVYRFTSDGTPGVSP